MWTSQTRWDAIRPDGFQQFHRVDRVRDLGDGHVMVIWGFDENRPLPPDYSTIFPAGEVAAAEPASAGEG